MQYSVAHPSFSRVVDDACILVQWDISGLVPGVQYKMDMTAHGIVVSHLVPATRDDYVWKAPLELTGSSQLFQNVSIIRN